MENIKDLILSEEKLPVSMMLSFMVQKVGEERTREGIEELSGFADALDDDTMLILTRFEGKITLVKASKSNSVIEVGDKNSEFYDLETMLNEAKELTKDE